MTEPAPTDSLQRLFSIALKTHMLLIGRDTLRAKKGKLHFVLITTDIAEASREEVLENFIHYPVVQHFTAAEFETFFNCKGAKAVGFVKSGLAQSIYAELKGHRINQHFVPPKRPELPPVAPSGNKAAKPFPSRRPAHR